MTARATVLATGGIGHAYDTTTNLLRGITGMGLALALQAGATLRDAEFVQFHPHSAPHRNGGGTNATHLRGTARRRELSYETITADVSCVVVTPSDLSKCLRPVGVRQRGFRLAG